MNEHCIGKDKYLKLSDELNEIKEKYEGMKKK